MQQGKRAECLSSPKAARAKDVFCNMKLDGYPRHQIMYFAARYRPDTGLFACFAFKKPEELNVHFCFNCPNAYLSIESIT